MNELSKQLNELAKLLSEYPVSYLDDKGAELLDAQDKLIDISNQAALKQFQTNEESYVQALKHIKQATDIIEKGIKKIDTISKVLEIVGKVLETSVKAVATVF